MGLLDGYARFPGLLGDPRWDAMVRPNTHMNLRPMSAPPAPPAQPQRSGMQRFGGALGQIFGGVDDPTLSAEQNAAARKQALLMAGLATLGSDQTGLKAVAQGAMVGQQFGAQGRQQAQAEAARQQRAQRIQAAVGNGPIDRATLERLFVEAIRVGDVEAAGDLSEVLKAMPAPGSQRDPARGTPEWLAARKAELELEAQFRGPRAPTPGTPEYYADLEERAKIAARYRPAPRTSAGSEGERKAAAFTGMVQDAKSFVDTIETAPGRVEQALSDKGIREFNDDEQQQLQLAGNAMAEAWLRMTTGAAYNEREFANAYSLFVPRPGDRKPALEWKRKNRQRLAEMIRTHSGRLAPPEDEPAPPAADDPFGDLIPGGM